MKKPIELGDEVQCEVTGLKGIAVARITHLTKCTQIHIQPKVDKDGKHVEGWYIDEPMLNVVTKGKIKPPVIQPGQKAGGPMTRARS